MATGLALTAFAYLWYTQLPPDGTFWRNLFVPFVLSGVGLTVTLLILRRSDVPAVPDS
jgi:hypothetical protein